LRNLQLAIVGFGTVGRWLAAAIHRRRAWLEAECGVAVAVVSVASRRDGFIHHDAGLDVPTLLDLAAARRPLSDYLGARHWNTALEGLAHTGADVLAEASNTNPREPEPALSHIRHALERGTHVITSSKGACAAATLELLALARQHDVQFRFESTVMSGTPVLSTLREGLAGTRVVALRGILNGTANHILTLMAEGRDYPAALADAQARGYAEPDPADDVEGHDVVAKARILAALAFGCAIPLEQVWRRGIMDITPDDVHQATRQDGRIKLVASLRLRPEGEAAQPEGLPLVVRIEPVVLPLSDLMARVDGVQNALSIETDTVSRVTVIGPGAGREQAGQGMFADLAAVAHAAA
jgi:homoserine dehydrogenase